MLRAVPTDVSLIIIFSMDEQELFETVKEKIEELIKLLNKKCPELVPIYLAKYLFTTEYYPKIQRIYYAIEILKTYYQLKRECEI